MDSIFSSFFVEKKSVSFNLKLFLHQKDRREVKWVWVLCFKVQGAFLGGISIKN